MNVDKLIVIGDIHGQTSWKETLEEHLVGPNDHAVFLGDYVDSFMARPEDMIKNLEEICSYAKQDSRVHLCVGNHDFHYMLIGYQYYSGYNDRFAYTYHAIFKEFDDLFNIAYFFEKNGKTYLCSHAGITKTFLEDYCPDVFHINLYWEEHRKDFGHKPGSPYGDDVYQSPLWVRPNSLILDAVPGFTQVVGHTYHDTPTCYDIPHDKDNSIWIVCGTDGENFAIF